MNMRWLWSQKNLEHMFSLGTWPFLGEIAFFFEEFLLLLMIIIFWGTSFAPWETFLVPWGS